MLLDYRQKPGCMLFDSYVCCLEFHVSSIQYVFTLWFVNINVVFAQQLYKLLNSQIDIYMYFSLVKEK